VNHFAGRVSAAVLAFAASILIVAGLLGALYFMKPSTGGANSPGGELMVYCAPAVKVPVEAIRDQYQALTGTPVRIQFSPSQSILTSAEIARRGDLFIPADDSYTATARKKNLIDESIPLLKMHAVIVVKKGNPKQIKGLSDLSREGVRTVLAGEAAAIGALVKRELELNGAWDALAKKATFVGSVSEAASAATISADASIVWNSMLPQFPALEGLEDAALAGVQAHVSVSVLKFSAQPTAALRFARFLAAGDKGLGVFAKNGYETEAGDEWEAEPQLTLFAGAMLRPAIETTLNEFEAREGVRVTRVYNGCGILVAQMRAGENAVPDGYFACDSSFMKQVADLYLDARDVSTNRLVILVPKGNPLNIKTMKDLVRPGLKVGVGHEKQCALGQLTATTFKMTGLLDQAMKNVKVQAPTGDMLVNQLLTGSLDAVVAYASNASAAAEKLDAIPVDVPCAQATQPLAVAKNSKHRRTTERLTEALSSPASRARFEALGFGWKR
jgi:ABC-type molybdate transport system substrate-binding protein